MKIYNSRWLFAICDQPAAVIVSPYFGRCPLTLKSTKNDGAAPGKKMLNDAFEEKGIPFRINSKQGGGVNRKSFWYVEAQ